MIWSIIRITVTTVIALFLLYAISKVQVLHAAYAGFALFIWLGISISWKDSSLLGGNPARRRLAATVRAMKKDGTFIELPGKRGVIDTLATYRGLVADGKSIDESDAIVSSIVREMSRKNERSKQQSYAVPSPATSKYLAQDMHCAGNANHELRR